MGTVTVMILPCLFRSYFTPFIAFIMYPAFLQAFSHLAKSVESVWSYRHLIHPATVGLLRRGVSGRINEWLGMLAQEVTAFCAAAKEAKIGKKTLAAYENKAMEKHPDMESLGRQHGKH